MNGTGSISGKYFFGGQFFYIYKRHLLLFYFTNVMIR
jgi:hypothetical protein